MEPIRAKPAYSVPEGLLSWETLKSITPKSALDAAEFVASKRTKPLYNYIWSYRQDTLANIDKVNHRGISLMASYYKRPPESLIIEGKGVEDNIANIRSSGRYYPPILGVNYEVLDGWHRLAALYVVYGAEFVTYVWKAVA